jgi:hypothetical protein
MLIKDHIVSIEPVDIKLMNTLKPTVISIDINTPLPAAATAAASDGSIYFFSTIAVFKGRYSYSFDEFLGRS